MNHSEECEDCDGSGFFAVWFDTSDGGGYSDEFNCPCRDAAIPFELCDECRPLNPNMTEVA